MAARALLPFLDRQEPWGDDESVRQRALAILAALGADGEPALDALVECLAKPEWERLRRPLFDAIATIATVTDRREAIRKALGDRCDAGKYFGATEFFACISKLGFDARVARDDLIAGLRDDNCYVRMLAAQALARDLRRRSPEQPAAAAIAEQLREFMAETPPSEFRVKWLWNGGEATTSGGVDADEHTALRATLAEALAAIAPGDPACLAGLERRLGHPDSHAVIDALRALGALGEHAGPAVPAVADLLQTKDLRIAREAATTLGMLGTVAKEAAAALEKAAASDDRQLAMRAKVALRSVRDPR